MSLHESIELLRKKLSGVTNLTQVLKFDCGPDGVVVIDGKASPPAISTADRSDVDVTVTLSAESFGKVVTGSLNPGIAFVMGKIKVKGDRSGLMALQKIL